MFTVSVENPHDGYRLFGPFPNADVAREFIAKAKKDRDNKVFLHDLMLPETFD